MATAARDDDNARPPELYYLYERDGGSGRPFARFSDEAEAHAAADALARLGHYARVVPGRRA